MPLDAMLAELPKPCDVGEKRNSKGYKSTWIGYKLHIDTADGGIPISCLLSSAALHDSQAAIPLAEITNKRDLMDAAYDAPGIHAHSQSLGHVPMIDVNPRTTARKQDIANENKAQATVHIKTAEAVRYNERSTVERVNARWWSPLARARTCQGDVSPDVWNSGAYSGSAHAHGSMN